MVRDYSAFFPDGAGNRPVQRALTALEVLGWGPFFAQQLDADELMNTPPVRVVSVHRSGLHVAGSGIEETIPPGLNATVGDWLMLDRARPNPVACCLAKVWSNAARRVRTGKYS